MRLVLGVSLLALGSAACVSLAQPGHYELPPPAETPHARSTLIASAASFSGGPPDVLTNLGDSFTAHVAAAGIFADLLPADTNREPDVLLRGVLMGLCQPTTVFNDPNACASYESFGYSGMNVLLALLTFGGWPAVSVFGVPTDWGRGHAEISVALLDPVSRVELAKVHSGAVSELGYGGLYYSTSPLANSFARAGELVIDALAAELPAVEKRVAEIARPRSPEEALASKDPAIRARALITIAKDKNISMSAEVARRATDEHPYVRRYAAEALQAIEARDPAARGALELLAKDTDDRARYAAHLALRALRFRAFAEATADAHLSTLILALASEDTRANALLELRALGPSARPALEALMVVYDGSNPEDRRAVAEVVVAIGALDARTEEALATLAKNGSREAELLLAQLGERRKTEQPLPQQVAPVQADRTPPLLAVFTIDASMLKPKERSALTDVFAALLTSKGSFRVVPNETIKKELARSKLASYRACVDESCQIELGKALAAEKVLRTQVIRQGGACLTTSTLYDLRTEASDRAAVAESACSTAEITRALTHVAGDLAKPR